jgi:hypothetical protein
VFYQSIQYIVDGMRITLLNDIIFVFIVIKIQVFRNSPLFLTVKKEVAKTMQNYEQVLVQQLKL